MSGEKIFVGRKAELDAFLRALQDPRGQAVLVAGQQAMGKTWLINRMMGIAKNHPELKCGVVRYEVVQTDSVDSTMIRMMDNAFEAAHVKEKSFDGTTRSLEQWRSFLNVLNIGDLVMSLQRDPAKNIREQFLERLRLISERMPDKGRAIFIIDPEKHMQEKSDAAWAIVVRELPEKIKFVFAQRPEDELVKSDVFRGLKNVVYIPEKKLDVLGEQEVNDLVRLRAEEVGQTNQVLQKIAKRYEGHPYAIQAALDIIKRTGSVEGLPQDPTDEKIAEAQWKHICNIGADAVRLFEAYAVLGGSVPDYIIEQVGVIDSASRKSLMANSYISGLFREEALGKRIYHAILADYVYSQINEPEKAVYISRAAGVILSSEEIGFFEKIRFIDFLQRCGIICQEIADELHRGFSRDQALSCYFYEKNDYGDVPKSGWLKFLKNAGEFEELRAVGDMVSNSQWLKAKYLGRVAEKVPGEVLSIISKIEPENQQIPDFFIEAIGNMPVEWIEKGIPVVKRFLDKREYLIWYFVGESSAKLMVKLLDVKPELAHELAALLLDLFALKDDEKQHIFDDIRAKFSTHEYNDLVFEYFKKVWEKEPYKGGMLVVEIFNKCLDELNKFKGFDASEHFSISLENLDEPSRLERDYEAIIVEAICQAGKEMIASRAEKVEEFLANLRDPDKAIFKRIEMYLLRFVKDRKYNPRINDIIGNCDYFDNPGFKYEYNLLLKNKKDVITTETIEQYIQWVKDIKVDDLDDFAEWFKRTRGRDHKSEDLEKYESGMRARKLYLVKDVFSDLYEKWKQKSGYSDEDLKPTPMVGEGRDIPWSEGSPKTTEELLEMSIDEVFEFVSEPENYKDLPNAYRSQRPKEGLAYSLQLAIKEKPAEYLNADVKKIVSLPKDFLSKYFYGIGDVLGEKEFEGFPWDRFLAIAKTVVDKYSKNSNFNNVFRPLLSCIQVGFEKGQKQIKYTKENINTIYKIIAPLISFEEEKDESRERDPVQIRCNSVTGEALRICLSLGIISKRDFEEDFEVYFKEKVRLIFNKVLNEIRTSWTCCTFGSDFTRIYWIDPEWIEDNLEELLSDNLWNIVWKTYLHWERPSKKLFAFLANRGIYSKAIEKVDSSKEKIEDRSKETEEELSKHVVIAYFNGWLESDKNKILDKFLEKASDKLRGHTARFFTTGFKSLKEEPDQQTVLRLKTYWQSRLGTISQNPNEHLEEAMALACWVVDTPFSAKETLRLVGESLNISEGKLDRNRDIYNFVNSVCDIADGNELEAVICIHKVVSNTSNEAPAIHFSFYEEKLTRLLNAIQEDNNASPEVLKATIELIDDLGRLRVYKYREMRSNLAGKLRSISESKS